MTVVWPELPGVTVRCRRADPRTRRADDSESDCQTAPVMRLTAGIHGVGGWPVSASAPFDSSTTPPSATVLAPAASTWLQLVCEAAARSPSVFQPCTSLRL